MTAEDHLWLTVPEAARELRVSVPTVWRWIRAGRLAASRVGMRSVRIRRRDLDQVLQARPATTPSTPGRRIVVGDATLRTEDMLARLRAHREAMLARRGGTPLPDSAETIREARRMRSEDL